MFDFTAKINKRGHEGPLMLYHGSKWLLEQSKHLSLAEDRHLIVTLDKLLQGVLVTIIEVKVLSGVKLLRPVEKLQSVALRVAREESGQEPTKGGVLSVLLFDWFSIEAVQGLGKLKHSLGCLIRHFSCLR